MTELELKILSLLGHAKPVVIKTVRESLKDTLGAIIEALYSLREKGYVETTRNVSGAYTPRAWQITELGKFKLEEWRAMEELNQMETDA